MQKKKIKTCLSVLCHMKHYLWLIDIKNETETFWGILYININNVADIWKVMHANIFSSIQA